MTEREKLPAVITAQAVAVLTEKRGSLVARGMVATLANKNDALYRPARDTFNRITDDGFRQNNRFSDQQQIELLSTIEIFQKLAKAGYGKAYYPLSIHCIGNDYEEIHDYALLSFDWCKKNKSTGDVEIWDDLANLYRLGIGSRRLADRLNSAFILYRKAAENNHAPAQTNMGFIFHRYSEEFGIARNYEQAAYWLQKAAEQGHALAQMKLGTMYELGRGVMRNCQQAALWYLKAAKQGHAMAQDKLGSMYLTGNGLPQDNIEAYRWFSLSAASRNKEGMEGLSIVESRMTSSQITDAKLGIQQME